MPWRQGNVRANDEKGLAIQRTEKLIPGKRNKCKGPAARWPEQSERGGRVGRKEVRRLCGRYRPCQGLVLLSEGKGKPWRILAEKGHEVSVILPPKM